MIEAAFEVPSDRDLEDVGIVIGGDVEKGEECVRTLSWSVDSGSGEITYDALGRSIRVLFLDGAGEKFLDVFREGAFRLEFVTGPSRCEATVDFATESLSGKLQITLAPKLAIRDSMLFG